MWLPGITTRESGNEFRTDNGQAGAAAANLNRGAILAPQYTKYGLFGGYMGDILTIQKITPPANQRIQITTVDTITKQNLLPRTQLSDLIALRMSQNEGT